MISVEVSTKATRDYVKKVEGRLRDMRPQNRAAAARFVTLVKGTFESRRSPWGTPWKRLSQVTLRERLRVQYGTEPLRASGWLYASIRPVSGRSSFSVSVDAAYAEFHQFGNTQSQLWGRPSVVVPARPILPIRNTGPDLPRKWWNAVLEPFDRILAP